MNMLAETLKLYQRTAEELILAVNHIKDGNLDDIKAAANAVKDLKQALSWAMDERANLEKLSKAHIRGGPYR